MKIIKGDAYVIVDDLIEEGMKVDHIITDPPYNISKENNFNTMNNPRAGVDFGAWDNEQPKIIYFDKPKHLSLDKIKKNDIISMPILGFEDVQPIKAIINKTEMDCVVEKDGEKIALVFISCQVLKDEKNKKS